MKLLIELALSLALSVLIGVLFVGFSIFLGKYELLCVALVFVGAASLRSLIPKHFREACESIPLLGEGLEIFNKLEAHYLEHRARSIFYYLFYPITSVFGFLFGGRDARRELGTYFYLIRWILILLVIESAMVYIDLSEHFSWGFSLKWLYLELLCLYFLANFFMVPLSTGSLQLSIRQMRARLSILMLAMLVILVGVTVFIHMRGGYNQIIPQNVALEQRFRALEPGLEDARVFSLDASNIELMAGLGSRPFALARLKEDRPFFEQLEHELIEALAVYLPEWRAQRLASRSTAKQKETLGALNARIQERLRRLSIFDEHELFYISLTQSDDPLWGMLVIPFRESILYFFKYEGDQLTLYDRWTQLSSSERAHLSEHMWDQRVFRFNEVKRLAQLITEHVTEQVQLELSDAKPEATEHDDAPQAASAPPRMELEESKSAPPPAREPRPTRRRARKPAREPQSDEARPAPADPAPPPSMGAPPRFEAAPEPTPPEAAPPKPFIVYDDALVGFDYPRALTQRLIRDHQGEMPELERFWWTTLYEQLLSVLFWMFKLSMPLHIALILYCRLRWPSEAEGSPKSAARPGVQRGRVVAPPPLALEMRVVSSAGSMGEPGRLIFILARAAR